jgi:predicted nucleic acid-binding protein
VTLVCFDTNFLIWGVKRQATPGQEGNVAKAAYLLDLLDKQDKQILIPSIVLGEALAALPLEQHAMFIDLIQRTFILAPYDAAASAHYARMWQRRARDTGYTRSETKADYMITAIAVANGCEIIFSNDSGLRRFAAEHIPVLGIEEIGVPPEQGQLF